MLRLLYRDGLILSTNEAKQVGLGLVSPTPLRRQTRHLPWLTLIPYGFFTGVASLAGFLSGLAYSAGDDWLRKAFGYVLHLTLRRWCWNSFVRGCQITNVVHGSKDPNEAELRQC